MGTIVVGYVAKPEGRAALERAIQEARLREASLVVVSSAKGGASLDPESAVELDKEMQEVHDLLHESGVPHEVRTLVRGNEPSGDLVSVAVEVDADFIVIGLRRRSPVGKLVLASHVETCVADAFASGKRRDRDTKLAELLEVFSRFGYVNPR